MERDKGAGRLWKGGGGASTFLGAQEQIVLRCLSGGVPHAHINLILSLVPLGGRDIPPSTASRVPSLWAGWLP